MGHPNVKTRTIMSQAYDKSYEGATTIENTLDTLN